MAGVFVTIDPGNDTGWALWEAGALAACGLGDPRSSALHVVEHVDDVWIEEPVIYPHSKARPNDIKALAMTAARWGAIYELCAVDVHFVEPARWKGQLPKDVCHARSWGKLQPNERAIVDKAVRGMAPSKRHNVLDAVAIGVWVLKRGA